MFSSLASYLLGTQQSQEPELSAEAVTADVRLSAVDGDDDWVLVEKAEEARSANLDDEDEPSESLPSLELAISTVPHSYPPSYQVLVDPKDFHALTRTSSSSSLPCLSFEESWFLTPPPCFTSEGPVHMETSPLENLLIEHPSMSVYQHSSSSHCFLPHMRHRSSSTGTAPNSPASSRSSSEDPEPPAPLAEAEHVMDRTPTTVQAAPRPRQIVYSLHEQQEKQCLQIRSAQKWAWLGVFVLQLSSCVDKW
ncbi:hypothetical protein C0J52_07437 [Blattella germanica]|nr:hypothetical protein C0J52_07437 [Blattella germanica]